jgi:hypothetical protein
MGRKYHRAERAELWIILVPMIVKALHRVGVPRSVRSNGAAASSSVR